MRLLIEIVAAALLIFCISATSAAFAAGKTGRRADGLSCSFSVPQTPRPPRAAPRSSGNAAASSTRIIAATSCCRRCVSWHVAGRGRNLSRRCHQIS